MPPATVINKYFYVPALGQYIGNDYSSRAFTMQYFGTRGVYTCSTAYDHAYGSYQWSFEFDNANVKINTINLLSAGIPLWKAQ